MNRLLHKSLLEREHRVPTIKIMQVDFASFGEFTDY